MDDSGRLDTLIKPAKSCIPPRSANKNILPPWDTSCCGREAWENLLKCHNFVTLDSSTQNASITMPLQESAVGFDSPVYVGAQPPKLYFGGFFVRIAWLFYMAGRAGAPSGAPVPTFRSINPVRSVSSFDSGDGGKQYNVGAPLC